MAICDYRALTKYESSIVRRATAILERAIMREPLTASYPDVVKRYLVAKYATAAREVFGVLFLDAQNRLLAFDEMFRGTLTETSVYPREVVRAALLHNAAAVMFVHNHPSGLAEPSIADKIMTKGLINALLLVSVRVLDHFVVGGTNCLSFAEQGLLGADPDPPPAGTKTARKKKAVASKG